MKKWRYRKTFISSYCAVKVYASSRRVYDLIENRLDFNGAREPKPRLEISFYLDEADDKDLIDGRACTYRGYFDGGRTLLLVSSGIARVTADSKKHTVKATVIDYREDRKEHLFELIFFMPLRFILGRRGLFFLHASMVSVGTDLLLISGPQNCGKSTVALVLAQGGFRILSDDDCFIRLIRDRIQIFSFPTKMGLNDRILGRFPEFKPYTLRGYRYGGKKRLSINRVSGQYGTKRTRRLAVIFPVYKDGRKNVLMRELSPRESLNRLAGEHRVLGRENDQVMFWAFYLLTKRARSFELIYNDDILNEIAGMIKRVLSSL